MTLIISEDLKDIWISIFRRKGGNGTYTRLFDRLDQSQRKTLLSMLELCEGEVPVVGSVRDEKNWLILSNQRLAWSVEGKRNELAVEDICDATADFRELQRKQQTKLGMHRLQILSRTGVTHTVEIEPGRPLSGTWNVLKNLAARNRRTMNKPN